MGFLTRIFSLKSLKSKKKQKQKQQQQEQELQEQQRQESRRQLILNSNEELQIIDDQEHEAAVCRLLRSSSARLAIVSEVEYNSLSPLPHPINNVIQTPASSTVSLSSSNTSHRGTYNVQVHKRKRHASTEFPFANRHLDDFKASQRTRGATAPPKEYTQYLGLRSDPSVASLLELYDDHGCLPETAFSNSPPKLPSPETKPGRAQTRRSGSTLRQLLGVSSSKEKSDSNADLTEGDISWAERFLGELDSVSSQSSLRLRTPTASRTHFIANCSRPSAINDDSTDHDLSIGTVDNPAINSMEVELSVGSGSSVNLDSIFEGNSPYSNPASISPQRASQVFTFLTQKRRSSVLGDASLPVPNASAMSRSSSGCSSTLTQQTDSASEHSFEPSNLLATPAPKRDNTCIPQYAVHAHRHPSSRSAMSHTGSERYSRFDDILENEAVDRPNHQVKVPTNEVKVLMTGPTKVIVTAPTPSGAHDTPSRIPRGLRCSPKKHSSSSIKNQPLLTECSNSSSSSSSTDHRTSISRPFKPRHRTSNSSLYNVNPTSSRPVERTAKIKAKAGAVSRKASFGSREKENRSALSVRAELPSTPIRSHSSVSDTRSLFRAIVTPRGYRLPRAVQPSPASSSELSPVGRQLMMDVRQQRLKAREAERERNRRRSERHGSAFVA